MGPQRLLVSDLDGTLLGDDAALARFRDWWSGAQRDGWALAYATGRTIDSVGRLIDGGALPAPTAAITNVGTEIHRPDGDGWARWPDWPTWDPSWTAEPARRLLAGDPRMTSQVDANQTTWKASYEARGLRPDEVDGVRAALRAAGIDATVVYSTSRDLDVLPPGSGKAAAARAVARGLGIDDDSVIAAGDTGNDIDLLTTGFRGVVVANAQPELVGLRDPRVFHAAAPYADGVLDGIRHWSAAGIEAAATR